jgi:hypothetical protein
MSGIALASHPARISPFVFPLVTCGPVTRPAQFAKTGRALCGKQSEPSWVLHSVALFSALATAQPGGSKADKNKNDEHHSRLKFWQRHKTSKKEAKAQAQSKQFQARKAQMKPVSAKQAAPKIDSKKDVKREQQEQPEQPSHY